MGHDTPGHDLVHVHRDLMLMTSGVAVVITALAWWRRDATRPWRVGLTVGSLVLPGLMTIGADRGAELVFRYGIGAAGEVPPRSDGERTDFREGHRRYPLWPWRPTLGEYIVRIVGQVERLEEVSLKAEGETDDKKAVSRVDV